MPPRRLQFTQSDIDVQLQQVSPPFELFSSKADSAQIHLLDPSSTTENLESLAPLIKAVHDSHHVEAFLRTTQGLVESKEKEIEKICGDNYQVPGCTSRHPNGC